MKKMMKQLAFTVVLLLFFTQFTSAKGRDFYQILTYRLKDKSQEQRVDNYLEKAYLPALHRAGIKSVGVFKPIQSDTTSGKLIFVWLPFSSLEQFDNLEAVLAKDALYQREDAGFLKAAFDNVPFERKESVLLRAFPGAPHYFVPRHKTNPSDRIYELRSYEGPTEYLFQQKMKMFNQGGEINIFKRLEFNAVFYGEVISGNTMPNLMYLTTFADMPSHDAHWAAFGADPEWKKLAAVDEYKHSVSKAVKRLLYPASYSDF
jgi:hypothetical protein